MRIIMGRNQDTRLMVVYGYSRLVGYNPDLELVPDILESFEVEEERIYTLKLRKGHKWSDEVLSRPRISATGGTMSPTMTTSTRSVRRPSCGSTVRCRRSRSSTS